MRIRKRRMRWGRSEIAQGVDQWIGIFLAIVICFFALQQSYGAQNMHDITQAEPDHLAATSQRPQCVIDAERDFYLKHNANPLRGAGHIALWCGLANGAEEILLPEKYDYDEQRLIDQVVNARKNGKQHYIIVNAEGIGHSQSMAKRIEEATGVETRATILGHMQRGGSPTCKDRVYATTMGAMAVDLLCEGKSNRVIGHKGGKFVDFDIDEALAMKKDVDEYMYEISKTLV